MPRADSGPLLAGLPMGRRLAYVALFVAMCGQPSDLVAQEPGLDEIIRTLNEWRESFVNIRVVWEMRNPEELREARPELASRESVDDFYSHHEWIWADHGASRFDVRQFVDGRVDYHDLFAWDGPRLTSFQAVHKQVPGEPEFLELLHIHRMPAAQPRSCFAIVPLKYVWLAGGGRWLGEFLAVGEGKFEFEGYGEIDDIRCARVKIDNSLLWLDPQHGFLPRRIDRQKTGETAVGRFTVDEFRRLESGIWFPMNGTNYSWTDPADHVARWVVTEVAVNERLDPKLFEPPAPHLGTNIIDGRTGRVSRHGAKRDRASTEQDMAEQAQSNLAPLANPVSAQVPRYRWFWWSGGLLGISVVVLGIGMWLSRRS